MAPFVVAHRAGNDLARLRAAERLPVRLVEADVHLFEGRLEVRHRKTLGPVGVLWDRHRRGPVPLLTDRWELARRDPDQLLAEDLLAAAEPDTELMLDLKGSDPRLPALVAGALTALQVRGVTICARAWSLLEPLAGLPGVRLVHSIGSRRQLRALRSEPVAGVSVHRALLDAATVARLKSRAGVVLTWPVETVEQARLLGHWGVDGVITEDFQRLAPLLAA